MILTVKVTTRAPRSIVTGQLSDGTLKVQLAAVPENGQANAELCRLLSAHYGGKPVRILTGLTSTRKQVLVSD